MKVVMKKTSLILIDYAFFWLWLNFAESISLTKKRKMRQDNSKYFYCIRWHVYPKAEGSCYSALQYSFSTISLYGLALKNKIQMIEFLLFWMWSGLLDWAFWFKKPFNGTSPWCHFLKTSNSFVEWFPYELRRTCISGCINSSVMCQTLC